MSEMTVRRDLAHSPARASSRACTAARCTAASPPSPRSRSSASTRRTASARAAAALVADGQTVMIDIGTTTLQLARHLHGRKVTVVTTQPRRASRSCCPTPTIELIAARRRSCAATTARSSACSPRTRCASSRPTSPFLGTSGDPRRSLVCGHDDGRGPDQARDDRRRRARRRCSPTRHKFTHARRRCGSAAPEALDHRRHRRAAPAACRSRALTQAGVEVTIA